jgi:conjugal transfer pilus assembly protein TraI
MQQIQDRLGLSNEAYASDVLPLLTQFAYYIQQVPASENHHHAHPGGLLDHSLEAAAIALRICSAKDLPLNTPTEERKKLAPVWRYGILLATLLHDLGKLLTSMEIKLYDSLDSRDPIRWHPDAGAMDMGKRYVWYTVDFPDVMPKHDAHSRLAWSLLNQVVPMPTRAWMAATDERLMSGLCLFLTGNKMEPFSAITQAADMESTAHNLKSGVRTYFASAKRKPFLEIMMENLRDMLADPGRYFSIAKDQGGDVFRFGELILIMSKTLADELRKYLNDHDTQGVPTDNERLFGTLYECGACLPNPFDANKYIWHVAVTMKSGATHTLTFICFKAQTLYPSEALWPKDYQGHIEPVSAATARLKSESTTDDMDQAIASADGSTISTVEHELQQTTQISSEYEQPPQSTEAVKSTQSADDPKPVHTPMTLIVDDSIGATHGSNESDVVEQINGILANMPVLDVKATPLPGTVVKAGHEQKKPQDKLACLKAMEQQTKLATDEAPTIVDSSLPDTESENETVLHAEDRATAYRPNNAFSSIRPVDVTEEATLPAIKFQNRQAQAAIEQQSVEPKDSDTIRSPQNKTELGYQFINWLQTGIANKELAVNNSEAAIHFVEQGLLLMTPKIFHLFTKDSKFLREPDSQAKLAQQAFEGLKLHRRSHLSGQYHANVIPVGKTPPAQIKVYWIPTGNAKALFSTLPTINPHIELLEKNNGRPR